MTEVDAPPCSRCGHGAAAHAKVTGHCVGAFGSCTCVGYTAAVVGTIPMDSFMLEEGKPRVATEHTVKGSDDRGRITLGDLRRVCSLGLDAPDDAEIKVTSTISGHAKKLTLIVR